MKAILAVLFMIPGSSISLVFPRLTGDLVDSIISDGSGTTLLNLAGWFIGLLIVQAVIGYVVSITLASITENVIATLRADLFNHIIRLPMQVVFRHRVGELASRLSSDVSLIQETFGFSVLQLIRQAVFLVGSIVIIVTTSLPLTLPILIGTPAIVAIAVVIGRKIRKVSTATQDALASASTIVDETLQSITAVKSFVREDYESDRYRAALEKNVQLAITGAKLRALFVTFIVFVIFGGIAGVILYGANLVAEHSVTIGELLSFLMYAMFVGGALGSFAELTGQLQKTAGAGVRIQELLTEPIEQQMTPLTTQNVGESFMVTPQAQTHDTTPLPRPPALEFVNVSFQYAVNSHVPILNNVSLSLSEGERVAFVGASGAGKSTAASLIQQLYQPTSGTIRYNGRNASEYSLAELRSSVGVVPQDIVLFGGTVEDNVRYGRLSASAAEVRDALHLANAIDFVDQLPDGLQTVVGERGMKLSGGQRQRIAIARAILKDPPILILDEATSSLDIESELLIQQALERLMRNRTTIIIAHRLSTVRTCDSIYVFERGAIVEHGNHKSLLQLNNGRYRTWCDLQFLS